MTTFETVSVIMMLLSLNVAIIGIVLTTYQSGRQK